MKEKIFAGLIVATFLIACLVLSWGIAVGIIKLITMCFGIGFNIKIATGIWLVLFLLSDMFSKGNNK